MRIIFVSNILTPHQIPLCDCLSLLQGVELSFFESIQIDKRTLPIGWKTSEKRNYVVPYNVLSSNIDKATTDILHADVVIFGSGDFNLIKERLSVNRLTFIYSERIYKNWCEFIKYPYHLIKFKRRYSKCNSVYLLCASAFAAKDYHSLGLFRNRAFKWGYFPKVDNFEVEARNQGASTSKSTPHIMWCARFLRLKHPELPVKLAARLKKRGYKFVIDMFGSGEELENTKLLAKKLKVEDVVNFCGNRPNDEILDEMRRHEIFLFTSDRNEGWGAVLNEAMSCGCAVVGSDKIGAVQFLIEDGVNGFMFRSGDIISLYEKVAYLLDNLDLCRKIALKGVETMVTYWSPENAAKALCSIIKDISNFRSISISQGPGSVV